MPHPWPIPLAGRTYFVETENELISAVGVLFTGAPIEHAPEFRITPGGLTGAHLNMRSGRYVLMAERDIRAWQALLTCYVPIDIDFDHASEDFKPENEEE